MLVWMNSIIASFRVMGYKLWCLTPLLTIFQLAAYCLSPKWATGSIWHKYPDPPSMTCVKRIPTFVDRVTSAPRTGASYLVNTLDANQLIVIKHRNTTSSFNSWSVERNGEKINVTVRTTIREELWSYRGDNKSSGILSQSKMGYRFHLT
jgi:hypothetical protein